MTQVEGWIKELESDISEKKILRTASKRSPSTSLENFKKIYQQLKDQLMKLKPPDGVGCEEEEAPKAITTETVEVVAMENSVSEVESSQQNAIDTDIDMEKMVKEMCEFDAT